METVNCWMDLIELALFAFGGAALFLFISLAFGDVK